MHMQNEIFLKKAKNYTLFYIYSGKFYTNENSTIFYAASLFVVCL